MLMKKLEMPIPEFRLKRHAEFKLIKATGCGHDPKRGKLSGEILEAGGIDPSGGPYQIFKTVNLNGQNGSKFMLNQAEVKDDASYPVKLNFQGHYNEPQLTFSVPRSAFKEEEVIAKAKDVKAVCR